jgi:DNA-binding transcriptional LysR family regulator
MGAPPRQPTLRHLRAFQAVAAHLNFRVAAESLALSQPALSAAVRELEGLLGTALFDRSHHHVALTPAGTTLLPHAEWLLNNFRHGVDDMRRSVESLSLSLRVGVMPSLVRIVAPELAAWQREFPAVRLTINDLVNRDLVAGLLSGRIDIAVGADIDLPEGLEVKPVGRDELVAVLPSVHRLVRSARRKPLEWRDLEGEPLALFTSASSYDLALAALRQKGLLLNIAHQMLYRESIFDLVQAGFGIGIVSHLYAHDVQPRELRALRLREPAITRGIVLMRRRSPAAAKAAAGSCFDFLAKRLQHHQGFPRRD